MKKTEPRVSIWHIDLRNKMFNNDYLHPKYEWTGETITPSSEESSFLQTMNGAIGWTFTESIGETIINPRIFWNADMRLIFDSIVFSFFIRGKAYKALYKFFEWIMKKFNMYASIYYTINGSNKK